MELPARLDAFDHPAWVTSLLTVAGYAVLLLVIFGALFLVPWLVVTLL